ncbi:MAG TPA: DUF6662 family protein [Gammaproteobacteria bacterium]
MKLLKVAAVALVPLLAGIAGVAHADENLFGYLKGAEPMPQGGRSAYLHMTRRSDKGAGHYEALDAAAEYEYGLTDRLTGALYLKGLAIDTHGLRIDGYLPKDEEYGLRLSGVEGSLKYTFLSPALDDFGLATYLSYSHSWLDPHSGQDKQKDTVELKLLLQKYYLDGQLIWVGNVGMESTMAQRGEINDLPAGFEWPTDPEMELGFNAGTGLSYRFAPGWFAGGELFYDEEHETDVGLERWSLQAGPSIHYGGQRWWTTLTYLPQLRGGGERYAGQQETDLHLIEKTKRELRLKIGYNF